MLHQFWLPLIFNVLFVGFSSCYLIVFHFSFSSGFTHHGTAQVLQRHSICERRAASPGKQTMLQCVNRRHDTNEFFLTFNRPPPASSMRFKRQARKRWLVERRIKIKKWARVLKSCFVPGVGPLRDFTQH